jgi:hypothetical protein
MSELTLTLIKLGFLGLLWLFVLSAVSVIRSDMFGERIDPAQLTGQGRQARNAKPGQAGQDAEEAARRPDPARHHRRRQPGRHGSARSAADPAGPRR